VANTSYTILVVPDRSAKTRKFRVQRKLLLRVVGALAGLFLLAIGMSVHYFMVVGQVAENRLLSEENAQLRTQVKLIHEKVAHVTQTLDRVERFDQKLRALTQLNDPERNLAIGPLPTNDRPSGDEDPGETTSGHRRAPEDTAFLPSKLDSLTAEADRQEQNIQELTRYFQDQKDLLASTPSIWPARGWVTSDFGSRLDPFTADRLMHRGLDIANAPGSPVLAPSDGVVIFDGTEGGYGNVLVLDHGYGVRTRFGHLAKIFVKLGDKVKRGDKVAAIGNTGRSTGPHLHYEVRVNGIPENPRKFILEEQ
jgi:murein DD-endopeptidase MepM/ murein hydrolase activator NlpD